MDFRDHVVKKALEESVGPYRPERSLRARLKRMAIVAVLALLALLAYGSFLHHSTPRPKAPAERKPIAVELVPAPKR